MDKQEEMVTIVVFGVILLLLFSLVVGYYAANVEQPPTPHYWTLCPDNDACPTQRAAEATQTAEAPQRWQFWKQPVPTATP